MAAAPEPASRLRAMGRAFADRNYRPFFAGQGVSLVGTWLSRLATGWLVFRLGGPDAAWLLGAVSFAGLAPTFFLAPLAGALVDRWDRHTVLVATQLPRLRRHARPVYARLGILPEAAAGVNAATELAPGPRA